MGDINCLKRGAISTLLMGQWFIFPSNFMDVTLCIQDISAPPEPSSENSSFGCSAILHFLNFRHFGLTLTSEMMHGHLKREAIFPKMEIWLLE
jgi:hypothetical protein